MKNILIFILFLTFSVYIAWRVTPVVTPVHIEERVRQEEQVRQLDGALVFQYAQNWREEQNLPKYKQNTILCALADQRLLDMKDGFSHQGFEDKSPTWIEYIRFAKIGENLLWNASEERQALNLWLDSPSHKENLVEDYTESCLRCKDEFCVHLFAK